MLETTDNCFHKNHSVRVSTGTSRPWGKGPISKLFGKSPGSSQSGKLRRPPIWCSNSLAEKKEKISRLRRCSRWAEIGHTTYYSQAAVFTCLCCLQLHRVMRCGLCQESKECSARLPLIAKAFIVWQAIIISARSETVSFSLIQQR